jgi:pimeloyl-ACP methyl ester carboxylesterase
MGAGVPLVFIHGIGGLPAYLELLLYLMALGNPLIVVEMKHVAMRLGWVMAQRRPVCCSTTRLTRHQPATTHHPRLPPWLPAAPVSAAPANCISNRHVQSVQEVAEAVLDVMDRLAIPKACIVAHSYGEGSSQPGPLGF